MPSAAAHRLYEDQIPSFMSVFDLGAEAMDDQSTVTVVDPKIIDFPGSSFDGKLPHHSSTAGTLLQSASAAAAPHSLPLDPSHRHNDSTSTQASESADSSPTTTMSCTDSSSLSDPSPSSSPDSPVNLVPLAAFPGTSFGPIPTLPVGLTSPQDVTPQTTASPADTSSTGVSSEGISLVGMSSIAPFTSGLPPALSTGMSALSVRGPNQTLERPVTSPSPRRRNMKGLSIQPPFVSPTLSGNNSVVPEPSSPSFIKPQIPAMKRKPSQLSLKTSTHDLIKSTALEIPQSPSLAMPPILQRRALKHSTSSPHMLSSLKSSTFGPAGGMTIPTVLERNESGLSEFLRPSRPTRASTGFDSTILEEESPIRTQIANRAAFEFEPYHEHENNEDLKTPGYPDGPIAIYNDNVFLYLEPTAEEASRFDVVFNVAREVRNPFKALAPNSSTEGRPAQQSEMLGSQTVPKLAPIQSASKLAPIQVQKLQPVLESIPEPESATEPRHEQSVFQWPTILPSLQVERPAEETTSVPVAPEPAAVTEQTKDDLNTTSSCCREDTISLASTYSTTLPTLPPLALTTANATAHDATTDETTPTTPKASVPLKEPEYIHIPWDHNTDIGQDLMMLCETIEKKTKEGKKVLIHCQQGASRSASLIIAYGMYQNPELSVNDAYYAAQAKSRWISPNMRLMYCLQDFQKEVSKKKVIPTFSHQPRSSRSPTKHRATLSADAIDVSPTKEPLSAPLLPDEGSNGSNGASRSLSPDGSPMTRPRGNSTPSSREAVSPGPSSAPSSLSWSSEKEDEEDKQKFGRFPDVPTVLRPPATGATSRPPLSLEKAPDSGFASTSGKSSLGSLGASLGSLDSMMKPPPSPGFAAHRFGEFPTGLSGLGNTSNINRINHINTTFNSRVTPLSISSFALFSPGLPPPSSANDLGLDSVLSPTAEPALSSDHGIDVAMHETAAVAENSTKTTAPELTNDTIHEQTVPVLHAFPVEDTLMSPRAETMTNNPLHDSFGEINGMNFTEEAPAQSDELELFSPRESMFPRNPFLPFGRPQQVADPRSPPTKGETPIVRSIDDLI